MKTCFDNQCNVASFYSVMWDVGPVYAYYTTRLTGDYVTFYNCQTFVRAEAPDFYGWRIMLATLKKEPTELLRLLHWDAHFLDDIKQDSYVDYLTEVLRKAMCSGKDINETLLVCCWVSFNTFSKLLFVPTALVKYIGMNDCSCSTIAECLLRTSFTYRQLLCLGYDWYADQRSYLRENPCLDPLCMCRMSKGAMLHMISAYVMLQGMDTIYGRAIGRNNGALCYHMVSDSLRIEYPNYKGVFHQCFRRNGTLPVQTDFVLYTYIAAVPSTPDVQVKHSIDGVRYLDNRYDFPCRYGVKGNTRVLDGLHGVVLTYAPKDADLLVDDDTRVSCELRYMLHTGDLARYISNHSKGILTSITDFLRY